MRMRHRGRLATILLPALIAGCGGGTEVVPPQFEIFIANGDGQFGTLGSELSESLHVVVTLLRTGQPYRGANVLWEVESGDAELTSIAAVATDSTGSARVGIRLGNTPGSVAVRASIDDQPSATVTFSLNAVDRPVVNDVSPASAAPGASVVLTGLNFSTTPEQNIVLFSGIRGTVTAASTTSLTVTVPACLPERDVEVTTQLGVVASGSVPLAIEAGGEIVSLALGGVADAIGPEGFTCVTVPGSASYLAIVQSTGSLGAATYPWTLTSLAATAATTPAQHEGGARQNQRSDARFGLTDPVTAFEEALRRLEAEAIARHDAQTRLTGAPPARVDAPARAPSVGERRTFQVYRSPGNFTEVTAEARFVGARAAFFVDDDAPGGGYEENDLKALSDQFDDFVYPAVASTFGTESDLDSSDRIVILLTPQVNVLTPRGSSGFVGGFFYGVDLLPGENGSNEAEILYSLVPDPSGIYSDPRTKERLLEATPAILAHELQHLVHFNERMIVRDAAAGEATWLSEGLAQYAEELVARVYDIDGDDAGVELFRDGARGRARRYLDGPDTVSLIISSGKGSLSERGGGFLFVMYLADRFGSSVIEDLTRSTNLGVDNVESETGTEWGVLLSDWWSALWLDGTAAESADRSYPTIDLRGFIEAPFPLMGEALGGGDVSRTGSMRSASAGYYIVTPDAAGSATFRLGGEAGGESLPQAGLKLRIIRIQ